MDDNLVSALRTVCPVKLSEPMSRRTTFGVGGPADIYVPVSTEDELRLTFATAKQHGAPVFIFGSGSNILVGDGGIRGIVIENRNTEVQGPARNGSGFKVRVGSGMSFSTLARRLSGAGYSGIEWACGIPGSLGGAVVSNAGAYGHSLSDVLVGARLSDTAGAVTSLEPDEIGLSYRTSSFLEGRLEDLIVLSVDLRLQKGDAMELKKTIREYDSQRKEAQPPGRNCGSVFKNPPDAPAWQCVDRVGLRGHRIGNAQFSEQHSNFILNLGGATAKDIMALIDLARQRVKVQLGIDLALEVMPVGEFS
jgi:UDP-N-acetylmuramate dehydrogenase